MMRRMAIDNSKFMIHLTSKRVLLIILLLQLTLFGLSGLDKLGLEIPILRQAVCIVYLTFIPGFLIMALFRMNIKNFIKIILYSAGLSLSFLMFIGWIMHFLCTLISGVPKPISEITLTITIAIATFFLYFFYYLCSKSSSILLSVNIQPLPLLVYFILPLTAILSAYLLRIYSTSLPLLTFLVVISVVPLFIALDLDFFKNPALLIFSIALSLFMVPQIFFPHIYGDDHYSYYFAEMCLKNGAWNSTIPNNANTLLSTTILPSIYSIIGGVSLEVVFKIFMVFIFSFTPLVLYQICQELSLDRKLSFLSSFLFLCYPMTLYYFPSAVRQELALLFMGLSILSSIDKEINERQRKMLGVSFILSLVVSHYGTSYLFAFSLIVALLYLRIQKFINLKAKKNSLSFSFVILAIASILSWQIYIGLSETFKNALFVVEQVTSHIHELLNPEFAHGLYYITREYKTFEKVFVALTYVSWLLIGMGLLHEFWKKYKGYESKIDDAYFGISLGFAMLILIGVILPRFCGYTSIDFTRLISINVYVLAPFLGFGWMAIKKLSKNIIKKKVKVEALTLPFFLTLYFLFGSGFAFEFQKEGPNPAAIFIYAHQNKSIEEKARLYSEYFTDKDVLSAKWISEFKSNESKVYADWYTAGALLTSYGGLPSQWLKYVEAESIVIEADTIIENCSYIFLTTFNNEDKLLLRRIPQRPFNLTERLSDVSLQGKVYDNGGATIWVVGG